MEGFNLEVRFPAQDRVSVFVESSFVDTEDEELAATTVFALFAARQIANLRGDLALAALLSAVDEDTSVESANALLGHVRLVPPSTGGDRKGFTAAFQPDGRGFFQMKPHGFGMLGRGVSDYARMSVLATLAHLLGCRNSENYRRALALTGHLVGMAGLAELITVTTQAHVAMEAAATAWAHVVESRSPQRSAATG